MSEMLGNYYFLIQNYSEAFKEYQKNIPKRNSSSILKKKLILCLIKLKRYEEAFQTYSALIIKNDLRNYSSTTISERRLCRQIIEEFENEIEKTIEIDKNLILGILWSFCDLRKAQKCFAEIKKSRRPIKIENKIIQKINLTRKKRSSKNGKQTNKS